MMKRLAIGSFLCASVAVVAACGETALAYGDANSIIAVMGADVWDEVSEEVYDTFEKTITTVRNEKKFTVTYQEPYAEHWMNMRRFRQMLIAGSREDPWVQEVLDDARDPVTENGVHQIYDVWSNGQTVTLILMDAGWTSADLVGHLESVSEMLDGQYRAYARNRMFMSGVDSALADTLSTQHGFHFYLPSVYRWQQEGENRFVFRNDNPDPSELIREIVVTWITPAASLDSEGLLAWREEMVAAYSEPQDIVLEGMLESTFEHDGNETVQVQAQWRNPPERGWPAGGPFITRAITCDAQDRTYYIDAWLYAPGKEKYEYMIQLETILDSFRCEG